MRFYIRRGSAGKMFISKCNECEIKFNWNKLVLTEGYDIKRCVPCHEKVYGELIPE